jgi:hypothetical protein
MCMFAAGFAFDKPKYPTRPIDRFIAEIIVTAEGKLNEDEKETLWNNLTPEEREIRCC